MNPDFTKLRAVQPASSNSNLPDFSHLQPIQSGSNDIGGASQSLSGSKAGLAHSLSVLAQSAYSGYSNVANNVVEGVAKGEGSTVNSLGGLVSKGLSYLPGAIGNFFRGGAQEAQQNTQSGALQPQGAAQNIGNTAEKVGEFFVPGSAESDLFTKGSSLIENIPKTLGITGKAADVISGALKVALKSGITGASTAGVTAAQGGNMGDVENAATIGGIAGGLGQTLESFGSGLAQSLQKSDFKLSPMQEAKASQKASSAAQFMTDNKILGSSESKYSKLTSLNNTLESTLQSSLPDNVTVPKNKIISSINDSIESLKKEDPAIYDKAKSDADKAINLLQSQEGDSVSVKDSLKAKRSYGSAAFKQTKFSVKDPNVVSEGSYAVEQAFQKGISDTLAGTSFTAPGLGESTPTANNIKIPSSLSQYFGGAKEVSISDFNKVYSNAITSKNLTGLARFKNDSGLVGRFFGLWAGEAIGNVVAPGLGGKIIGGATGEIASSHLPGLVRNLGERTVAQGGDALTTAAKTGLGMFNQPNQ